jgi:hypothetical protein
VHVPQLPPQPSEPHSLPPQAGVQHVKLVQTCPAPQPPQLTPQYSPHSMPSHDGEAGHGEHENPQSLSQAAAQNASHASVQQVGYFSQTHASHAHPGQPAVDFGTHGFGSGMHFWIPSTHSVPALHVPHENPSGSLPHSFPAHCGV